jgi:linoleoyl-CoA desaturase
MATHSTVRFNKDDQPEFFQVLRKRVNQHFTDNGITKYGDGTMVFKTVFMIALYVVPLILMLTGVVQATWAIVLMWLLMSLGMSGIGFSVMHDANHGAYSPNQFVNDALGGVVSLVGGYHINWRIQHNVLHHSYTNVHEHDEDIDKGIMRFSPDQERKPAFKYQVFYAPFLYGLMTIFWLVAKDFIQTSDYHKRGLLKAQGLTFGKALTYVILLKTFYVVVTLVLPILLLPFAWWQTLLCFLMMHFLSGLFLAFVFQSAHVLEETHFFKTDENGSVENSWAVHQLKTTANFSKGRHFFSWFIGGLNYQVEHHLFPNICHIHYPDIAPIVKATAEEYGVPYYEHPTFFAALKSHFTMLHKLGTGAYDRQLAAA